MQIRLFPAPGCPAGGFPLAAARRLAFLACLALFLPAGQALAGATYRMAGTHCTDSNRTEIFYPEAGLFGPGPTLCADELFAQVTVSGDYIPGSQFDYLSDQTDGVLLQTFTVDDGARPVFSDFQPNDRTGFVRGTLPAGLAATVVRMLWHEGWFLETKADGTWIFGAEFGARDGVCGLGSIEGPNVSGEACIGPAAHYFSTGTYTGWVRVAEPASLASLALALAALAAARRPPTRTGGRRAPAVRPGNGAGPAVPASA